MGIARGRPRSLAQAARAAQTALVTLIMFGALGVPTSATGGGTDGAAQPQSDAASECPRVYQSLRYDEDWSCLQDIDRHRESWDAVKYIDLGDERFLTLGGDARWRFERYVRPGFGAGQEDRSGYALQRYLFHGDVRLSASLRAFAQLQSSWVNGRTGGPRRSDLDRIDLHQAFVDVRFGDPGGRGERGGRSLTIRAGRQEVEFGSSRLVSTRDTLNARLSFDGVRVMARTANARVWGFVLRPVEIDPGVFDDGPERRTMWGISIGNARESKPMGNLAAYLSGLHAADVRYDQGSGAERRLTFGVRAWGAGRHWDYNIEPIVQWGRFGAGRIRAWAAASDVGVSWRDRALRPRVGLRADITSGDRGRHDLDLQTFSPLFAGVPYSGLAGLVGPSNVWDLTPSISIAPRRDLVLTAGSAWFSRTSRADGIYGINLNLERTGQQTRARHIGTQTTLQAAWSPTRHVTAAATVTYFNAGRFLRETPPGRDVFYTTMFVTYRF